MKIVERAGTKIVRMLQRNDPFKTKRCPRPGRCLVCSGIETRRMSRQRGDLPDQLRGRLRVWIHRPDKPEWIHEGRAAYAGISATLRKECTMEAQCKWAQWWPKTFSYGDRWSSKERRNKATNTRSHTHAKDPWRTPDEFEKWVAHHKDTSHPGEQWCETMIWRHDVR